MHAKFTIAGIQMTVGNRDNTDDIEAVVRRALTAGRMVDQVVDLAPPESRTQNAGD